MAFDAHPIFATTTLTGGACIASGSGTSMVIASSGDFPDPASGNYNVVICPANTPPSSTNAEVVRATAKSGTTVTIARAQEGTAALTNIAVGYQAFVAITPKNVTDIESAIPTDATIVTTDVTTNNVSTSKHGWTPKAPNDATKFLNGVGGYTVPAGTGTGAPGYEYDYVQRTTNYTLTTEADYIVGNAVAYDGSTRVKIEFWVANFDTNASPAGGLFRLYDGTTVLNRLVDNRGGAGSGGYGVVFLTPTAATHTYKVTAVLAGSGTLVVNAAAIAAGAGSYSPSWLRITKA